MQTLRKIIGFVLVGIPLLLVAAFMIWAVIELPPVRYVVAGVATLYAMAGLGCYLLDTASTCQETPAMHDCPLSHKHYEPPKTFRWPDGATVTVPGGMVGECPLRHPCPPGYCDYKQTQEIINSEAR